VYTCASFKLACLLGPVADAYTNIEIRTAPPYRWPSSSQRVAVSKP